MIDRTGKVIAPLKYDNLDGVSGGRIVARLGNSYGYLDYTGKVAIGFDYEEADSFENGLATVLKKGADDFTTINRQGQIVTPKPEFW